MRSLFATAFLLGMIAAAPIQAKLITFNVDGTVLDCEYGGGCNAFAEQTGLPPPEGAGNYADFGLTFTLDTAAALVGKLGGDTGFFLGDGMQGRVYSIDSPGAGLSIRIGALTLFSSRFFLAMGSEETSDGLYTNGFGLYGVYPDYPEYWFEFGSVSDTPFSAFSLSELIQSPLAEFDRMPLNPSGCAVRISMPAWTVCGARTMTIEAQTVPEPSTIATFCLGLVVLGVLWFRPHKASSR